MAGAVAVIAAAGAEGWSEKVDVDDGMAATKSDCRLATACVAAGNNDGGRRLGRNDANGFGTMPVRSNRVGVETAVDVTPTDREDDVPAMADVAECNRETLCGVSAVAEYECSSVSIA
jgi:hypothetical protein